jgi:oleate hydratase
MLNFNYLCTYELLSRIPSLSDSKRTVKQEIDDFNSITGNKTNAHARLVRYGEDGPYIIDVSCMGLNAKQRLDLMRHAAATEKHLGAKRIDECFDDDFFTTNFWSCGTLCERSDLSPVVRAHRFMLPGLPSSHGTVP